MLRRRFLERILLPTLAVALASLVAAEARAGCGCTKPPPAPSMIRPHVAWKGLEVHLFHPGLVDGRRYTVRFSSGVAASVASVESSAVIRRDLADGRPKAQLVVRMPSLPLGPVAVWVAAVGATQPLLQIADHELTAGATPVAIPTGAAKYTFLAHRAAVSRDGVVYVPLDFSQIKHARVFEAQALGLPLRFGNEDLAFYNRQGFLMQLLGSKMPGLYALTPGSTTSSNRIQYSRHEFNTYFLQHGERADHAVDATDPEWHLNGTPHIDHDLQVLEIDGRMPNGSRPVPGASDPFDLYVQVDSLFRAGIASTNNVNVSGKAIVASMDSRTGSLGSNGAIRSKNDLTVEGDAIVRGTATAKKVQQKSGAVITGAIVQNAAAPSYLPIEVPAGLPYLGRFEVAAGVRVLGPGTYRVTDLLVKNDAQLFIKNATGPVTIYATGKVEISSTAGILAQDRDPEKFAIYALGDVKLQNGAPFYGVIYAPNGNVEAAGRTRVRGAVVGHDVKITGDTQVYFDEALRGEVTPYASESPANNGY